MLRIKNVCEWFYQKQFTIFLGVVVISLLCVFGVGGGALLGRPHIVYQRSVCCT